MKSQRPKSIEGLMRYLRNEKGISIHGSQHKRKLLNMGYYHGYKGYRYIKLPSNIVSYTKFEELIAVYNFDAQLKSLFYPNVMLIETAIKNYVLESLVSLVKSDNFIDVYNMALDDYKRYSTKGKSFKTNKEKEKAEEEFKKALKKRLDLRSRIYKIQSRSYGEGSKIADHYFSNDDYLPIWAIFELLCLGEFGHFVSCLNKHCRADISKRIGIRQADDTGALMPQRLIYITKDLRNAIAHNDVIFDTRFSTGRISKQVRTAISNATGIKDISFNTITDYLILIIYQLKLLHISKTEMKRIITNFESIVDRLRISIPTGIFNQIIHTDNNAKILQLKKFVSMK